MRAKGRDRWRFLFLFFFLHFLIPRRGIGTRRTEIMITITVSFRGYIATTAEYALRIVFNEPAIFFWQIKRRVIVSYRLNCILIIFLIEKIAKGRYSFYIVTPTRITRKKQRNASSEITIRIDAIKIAPRND